MVLKKHRVAVFAWNSLLFSSRIVFFFFSLKPGARAFRSLVADSSRPTEDDCVKRELQRCGDFIVLRLETRRPKKTPTVSFAGYSFNERRLTHMPLAFCRLFEFLHKLRLYLEALSVCILFLFIFFPRAMIPRCESGRSTRAEAASGSSFLRDSGLSFVSCFFFSLTF